MADVFLSYGRADHDIARAIAEQLQADGRTVWWDAEATPGASFREEIARQLDDAKFVIVLWTPNSVRSQWVISEAQRALIQKKLIPVRTSDVDIHEIPQPFDILHTPLLGQNVLVALRSRLKPNRWFSSLSFFGLVLSLLIAIPALIALAPLAVILSGRSVLVWQDIAQPGETYHLKGYGNLGDSKGPSLACYYFTGWSIVGVAFWYSPNDIFGRHRCPPLH
jgi:hypothetical protein